MRCQQQGVTAAMLRLKSEAPKDAHVYLVTQTLSHTCCHCRACMTLGLLCVTLQGIRVSHVTCTVTHATHVLSLQGVYDIGSVPPLEVSHVFSAASFEDDRELSTTMTFTLHHGWAEQGLLEGHGIQHAWAPSWARPVRCSTAMSTNSSCSSDFSSMSSSRTSTGNGSSNSISTLSSDISDGTTSNSGSSRPTSAGQQDLFARVPAPATEEVRRSASMQKLLLRKMEQVLGPPAPTASVSAPAAAAARPPQSPGPKAEQQQVQQDHVAAVSTGDSARQAAGAPAPAAGRGGSDGMLHHGSSWEWTGSQKDIPQQRPRSQPASDGGMYEI
jgi:hypothetical protein